MSGPPLRTAAGLLVVLLGAPGGASGQASLIPGGDEKLRAVQHDLLRLRRELESLRGREQGLLDTLARLDAELAVRTLEADEVGLRLARTSATLEHGERSLRALDEAQRERARHLAFRLREVYKRGPASLLKRFVGGEGAEQLARGLRYAAYLNERDARRLQSWRAAARGLAEERARQAGERDRLAALRVESEGARVSLTRARAEQGRFLDAVRTDRRRHQEALVALEDAARDLGRIVEGAGGVAPPLDVRKFRGLLDWPVEGRVASRFGRAVHPKFGTSVPHPGLDLDASAGSAFRAVFDGTVVFASSLRGYGLTAIVDHGGGLATVYAHASALLVEKDQEVLRGQTLGHVGRSDAGGTPGLYFEVRDAGRPVDPEAWLAARRRRAAPRRRRRRRRVAASGTPI